MSAHAPGEEWVQERLPEEHAIGQELDAGAPARRILKADAVPDFIALLTHDKSVITMAEREKVAKRTHQLCTRLLCHPAGEADSSHAAGLCHCNCCAVGDEAALQGETQRALGAQFSRLSTFGQCRN